MGQIGIDLGTTSIKICLVKERNVVWEKSFVHNAGSQLPYGIQSVKTILDVSLQLLQECLLTSKKCSISPRILHIAGQMHGIVFWNSQQINCDKTPDDLLLYTWLYENILSIEDLPSPSQNTIHKGFGSLTFLEKADEYRNRYDRCGTIMDLLACVLTGNSDVQMSEQLAVSWGYCSRMSWDQVLKDCARQDIKLPTIVKNTEYLGKWMKFPSIKVKVPIGDLQASVASVRTPKDITRAYIVMGTSAQLCVVSPRILQDLPVTVTKLPYSGEEHLYASCSMNGGSSLDNMLKMFDSFLLDIDGSPLNHRHILGKLDEDDYCNSVLSSGTFIEERNVPKWSGLNLMNLKPTTSIWELLQSLCIGVVDNLFELFPSGLLLSLGVRYVVLVGGAKKNRFRRRIEEVTRRAGLTLEAAEHETSAAFGAVIFDSN